MNTFLSIYRIRNSRASQAGIYANHAKVEPSVKAEAIISAANGVRLESMRDAVQNIITQAVYNADDSCVDSYGAFEQRDYPTLEAFWAAMFESSLKSLAAEGGVSPRAVKFFSCRGFRI
jgi:hypothetical protein